MSLFTDRVADVYTLTNRADLVNETALAVKSATLKMHRADFFSKDLFETGISFPVASYTQTLDYRALLPLWRKLKYLRKYDAVGLAAGDEFEPIAIEKVLDGYLVERQDVIYLAGAVYQLKSSTVDQYYLLGAYLNPSIDPNAYTSWIAIEYPYAIVYEAARVVLSDIHQDDLADKFEKMANEQLAAIIRDNIGDDVGS